MSEARRINCHCGCGAWFYWKRRRGRPPLYMDVTHYQKERNRVRNQKRLIERNRAAAGGLNGSV